MSYEFEPACRRMEWLDPFYKEVWEKAFADAIPISGTFELTCRCNFQCRMCYVHLQPDRISEYGGELSAKEWLRIAKEAKEAGTVWLCITGGEPLLQMDFLLDFCKKAKAQGVNITIDTSGNPFSRKEPFFSKFQELLNYVDLFLLDIKEINDETHRDLTGCSNENILDMARYLSEIGKPVWIRHVLVPEYSDKDEDLKKLDEFIRSLKNVERVEVLPYHTLGVFKWKELGLDYPLEGIDPPSKERIANANELLHTADYTKYLE